MKPYPCGFRGDERRSCTCDAYSVRRYMARLSGPLLDRIDMHVEVRGVQFDRLQSRAAGPGSAELREKVLEARDRQLHRFNGAGVSCNASMGPKLVSEHCRLSKAGTSLVKTAFEKRGLSARSYDRVLKVSRTIADVSGKEKIKPEHLAQALNYRGLELGE